MANLIFKNNNNFELKHDAFQYQIEAFNAIKDLPYSAIFHEQGLGKTKIAINLMIYWIQKKNIDTVIVVTKKLLIKNWEKEFSFHTYLKPKFLTADRRNNYFVFNSATRIIVTNFETISAEKERLKLFLKTRNVAIVIDESTKIKNPLSKLTQDFFDLSNSFKIKTIMSGTPIANRPYDIWSQIYFLDNGKSLGADFETFKINNDLSNKLYDNKKMREQFEKSISEIYNKIKEFTVRETKKSGIISLPKKVYQNVYVDFEKEQGNMYNKLKEEYSLLVQKGDETILDESEDSLKRLLRLLQITSNPRLVNDLYGYISAKERKLKELLNKIVLNNEKVIVWTNFIENVDYFQQCFKQFNPVKIHGRLSIDYRNKSIDKFLNDNNCKVLFATPQSAKEGLTLTVANNVIFYDRSFNLDDYLQAQDRIHRISQLKQCYIYNIIVKNSIDIWIDKLLDAKQKAAFLAQGDYNLDDYQKTADYSYANLVKDVLFFDKKKEK